MEKTTTALEYEKAIQYIYGLIQNGELTVDSRLPTERAISETVGIGRNSTRQALSILHGMGMIESIQGSGNYVSGNMGNSIQQILMMMLTLGSITTRQVCEFRRVMEKAVCMTLLQKELNRQKRQELSGMLDRMAGQKGKKLEELDGAFHAALTQATENPLFITIVEAVTYLYRDSTHQALQKADEKTKSQLLCCHRKIYEGIVDKDMDKLMTAVDKHYDLIEEMF